MLHLLKIRRVAQQVFRWRAAPGFFQQQGMLSGQGAGGVGFMRAGHSRLVDAARGGTVVVIGGGLVQADHGYVCAACASLSKTLGSSCVGAVCMKVAWLQWRSLADRSGIQPRVSPSIFQAVIPEPFVKHLAHGVAQGHSAVQQAGRAPAMVRPWPGIIYALDEWLTRSWG